MSSRRKSLALAGVTAALAVAGPVASANAAPTATPIVDPTVCSLLGGLMGPYGPTALPGGASLGGVLKNAGGMVGCSAPAAPQWPFPVAFGR